MAWRRTGAKPLSEPMLTQFIDIYVALRRRWVNSPTFDDIIHGSQLISITAWRLFDTKAWPKSVIMALKHCQIKIQFNSFHKMHLWCMKSHFRSRNIYSKTSELTRNIHGKGEIRAKYKTINTNVQKIKIFHCENLIDYAPNYLWYGFKGELGIEKMVVILQTFWKAFLWMKIFQSQMKIHWNMLRDYLKISQHWFR